MFLQVLVAIQSCNVLLNNALDLFRFVGCKFTVRVSEYINRSCEPQRAYCECKQAIKATDESNDASKNPLFYLPTSVVYIKLSL